MFLVGIAFVDTAEHRPFSVALLRGLFRGALPLVDAAYAHHLPHARLPNRRAVRGEASSSPPIPCLCTPRSTILTFCAAPQDPDHGRMGVGEGAGDYIERC